ncbi:2511_t:CDS:2 [Acaulospora morrowiae]|uniref:2511_t:CDS:1 n=1 Tax=Acaulospora morrowiae TaxID=94023 RepID=A0A9N8V879_9GLOM|nr:2511_t:CDS:2 [Acaulospora morrowiae]
MSENEDQEVLSLSPIFPIIIFPSTFDSYLQSYENRPIGPSDDLPATVTTRSQESNSYSFEFDHSGSDSTAYNVANSKPFHVKQPVKLSNQSLDFGIDSHALYYRTNVQNSSAEFYEYLPKINSNNGYTENLFVVDSEIPFPSNEKVVIDGYVIGLPKFEEAIEVEINQMI